MTAKSSRWWSYPEITTERALEILGAEHAAWWKAQPATVRQSYINGAWFANDLELLAAYRQLSMVPR